MGNCHKPLLVEDSQIPSHLWEFTGFLLEIPVQGSQVPSRFWEFTGFLLEIPQESFFSESLGGWLLLSGHLSIKSFSRMFNKFHQNHWKLQKTLLHHHHHHHHLHTESKILLYQKLRTRIHERLMQDPFVPKNFKQGYMKGSCTTLPYCVVSFLWCPSLLKKLVCNLGFKFRFQACSRKGGHENRSQYGTITPNGNTQHFIFKHVKHIFEYILLSTCLCYLFLFICVFCFKIYGLQESIFHCPLLVLDPTSHELV